MSATRYNKIYLYVRGAYKAKYEFEINKKSTGLKHLYSEACIKYSNDMGYIYKNIKIYKNIEECNPNRTRKTLIVFDDLIANMVTCQKISPIVTELSIRVRKLNISLVFARQLNFAVLENIINNYFIIKIPNIAELQHIAFNHSSDINFRELINLYKKCTAKPYFVVIDVSLASDNLSCFRKNIFQKI